MKPELNFNAQAPDTLRRVLSMLRKIRAAIEVEANYLCNEAHWIGRSSDTEAMNIIVLWIAKQLETEVAFIDGEFKCYATLSDHLDKTLGHDWRDGIGSMSQAMQLMRMAWCDKMIEDLEQKCIARGVELT